MALAGSVYRVAGSRRGWWRALVLALALGTAACDSVEDRVARHHARGLELNQKGDGKRAALEFRNALRLNENHAASRYEIAKLYQADGELRAAVGNYRMAADLDVGHLDARLRLAQLLMMGNALDEAQTYADQAVALAPGDPDALATRAAVLLRRDRSAEALAEADKALAIRPLHVGATLVVVSRLMADGANDTALKRLDPLIAAEPRNLALRALQIQLLERAGDTETLGTQLAAMTELFPDRPELRRSYVQWLIRSGRLGDAEAQLRSLADAQPAEVPPVTDLVRFVASQRGIDAARRELEARAAAAPAAARPAFARARADFELGAGQTDAAVKILGELIAASEPRGDGAAARVRLGEVKLQQGRTAEARALADAVLAVDPGDTGAVAVRAGAMIESYEAAEAAVQLRRALEQDPQNVRLMLLMAVAYERSGSPDLAAERLAAATRASGNAPDTALRYAAFLRGRGQHAAAETVLAETARVNPTNRMVLAGLAEVQLHQRKFDAAARTASALRALDPDDGLASRIEAAALVAQGRVEESIRSLEQLIATDPAAGTLAALVSAYVRSGDIARAEALLDGTLAAAPDDVAALVLRAELHIARGQTTEAEARLRDVVARAPTETAGHLALSRFYAITGRRPEAEAAALEGIGKARNPNPLRLLLAQYLETRGDFDGAIAHYRALYDSNRDSTLFANNLASLIADHQADDPEAIAFAVRIAQRLRGSTVPQMQDTYGWLRFLQGDHAEALRSLIPAAAALPNNPLVQYHAGRAYAAIGQVTEARMHLERALAIDPGSPKAESARSALAALPPAN